MKKSLAIALGLATIISMSLLFAQDAQQGQASGNSNQQATSQPQAKVETVKGEVIEMSCYANSGAKGASHKECAVACANDGHSLGLLEDGTGKVYTVVSPIGQNTKDALMPFIAEHVEVTGSVIQKGGMNFLNMKSIEKMKS